MKPSLSILFCAALLTGWASADQPKKAPISRYTSLWLNSPFTSKPPPVDPSTGPGAFDDYALAGVSPISGGYRVTLMNKKNPEERTTVDSDNPHAKFKIVQVIRKVGDPLGTTVRLSSGSANGTVSYDEKLLAIAAPKVAAPHPPQPQVPGQPIQPQPVPGEPMRQPRPRVVPPPIPAGGAPVPQVQQGQPAQQNQQRPERRRN